MGRWGDRLGGHGTHEEGCTIEWVPYSEGRERCVCGFVTRWKK